MSRTLVQAIHWMLTATWRIHASTSSLRILRSITLGVPTACSRYLTDSKEQFLFNIKNREQSRFSITIKRKNNEKDKILLVDDVSKYNSDKYNAIDGHALKQCDKLSAFVEASLSISHGIKSKELINGKKEILKALKEVQGVDFKAIAMQIDYEFGTTGQTQARMDFD